MAIPDGKPATDFSAMNREWVKGVAAEAGGEVLPEITGADEGKVLTVASGEAAWAASGSGLPPVTAADNGKILGVVNGAWGAMDAGGGSSDIDTATITLNLTPPSGVTIDWYQLYYSIEYDGMTFSLVTFADYGCIASQSNVVDTIITNANGTNTGYLMHVLAHSETTQADYIIDGTPTLSGDISVVHGDGYDYYAVTGDCSITGNLVLSGSSESEPSA